MSTIKELSELTRQDVMDLRDVIARVEELESDIETFEGGEEERLAVDVWKEELAVLQSLLEELKGNGGDEQWRGDWYPISLISDSYFVEYAQELAEDIGAVNTDAKWPNNCIDWEQAARELQMDYSLVDFEGATYWYR